MILETSLPKEGRATAGLFNIARTCKLKCTYGGRCIMCSILMCVNHILCTVVAPPSHVVKCLWGMFFGGCWVWFLSCVCVFVCVCVGVGGVVLCRCVYV